MAAPRTAACVTRSQRPSTFAPTTVGSSTKPMDLLGTAELWWTLQPLCIAAYMTCAATGITSPHSARPSRPMLWPVRPLVSRYDRGDLAPSAVRFHVIQSMQVLQHTLIHSSDIISSLLVLSFVMSKVQPLPSLHKCLPSFVLGPHCSPLLCSPLH